MAITKITAPNSTPNAVSDYEAQNNHIMAFINQINSQAFILSDPDGTDEPTIKISSYLNHGGSLYIVDTADESISGSPSDGSVYIRVSGGDELTAEYITDISGYDLNHATGNMVSGGYTLLPYLIIKSGTSWTKYRLQMTSRPIYKMNQDVETTDEVTFSVVNAGKVNTGQGDNELYAMNQNVRTTDSPTFAKLTLTTSTYGSQSIGGDSSWVVPAGIYILPTTLSTSLEIWNGSSWIPSGISYTAYSMGTIVSDGSNMRVTNNDSSTITIHYRKFS